MTNKNKRALGVFSRLGIVFAAACLLSGGIMLVSFGIGGDASAKATEDIDPDKTFSVSNVAEKKVVLAGLPTDVPENGSLEAVKTSLSPQDLTNLKFRDILAKNEQAIVAYILSRPNLLWGLVTEVEIMSAIEAGIERYPEIMEQWGPMIVDSCRRKGIDPDLGIAIVSVESQGYRKATSNKGAKGIWQNMEESARFTAMEQGFPWPKNRRQIDSLMYDPHFSTFAGTCHLARSLRKFGDTRWAVVAYEAGDGEVRQTSSGRKIVSGAYWQVKRYGSPEKVPYYRKVMGVYKWIKENGRQIEGEPPEILVVDTTNSGNVPAPASAEAIDQTGASNAPVAASKKFDPDDFGSAFVSDF